MTGRNIAPAVNNVLNFNIKLYIQFNVPTVKNFIDIALIACFAYNATRMMISAYKTLTTLSAPLLRLLLKRRLSRGKEDPARWRERMGQPSLNRPAGKLIWIHAASVGEAQSALILIEKMSQETHNAPLLVTTGTRTSAELMAQRLPPHAMHQFYPLDHPDWVRRFLNHWQPDLALFLESELWPNMLSTIKAHNMPTILINARLSDRACKRWRMVGGEAKKLLECFSLILAQSSEDAQKYKTLGAKNIIVSDTLKYSAAPLPFDQVELDHLHAVIGDRPCWVYASTHDGEEDLAARIHTALLSELPNLLTILVPRHPHRRDEIAKQLHQTGLNITFRGENKTPPTQDTNIYVADTLGELGLFYSLSPIAMIGRSFSHDGGGGHNPVEAAQLGCAVLTGPHTQFQKNIFDEMILADSAQQMLDETDLKFTLKELLQHSQTRRTLQQNAKQFAARKTGVVEIVMGKLAPFLVPFKEQDDVT